MKIVDFSVPIADTETAWGVDAAVSELLARIKKEVRADLLLNKTPVTYNIKIERK